MHACAVSHNFTAPSVANTLHVPSELCMLPYHARSLQCLRSNSRLLYMMNCIVYSTYSFLLLQKLCFNYGKDFFLMDG